MCAEKNIFSLTIKKGKFGKKGIIQKSKNKVYVIINDTVYFVTVKALQDVLSGKKDKTPLWGY